MVTVKNPDGLKIRLEKQIAMVLGLSRDQVKKLMVKGEIEIREHSQYLLSIEVAVEINQGVIRKPTL